MNQNNIAINDDLIDLFRFNLAGTSIRLDNEIEKSIITNQYIHNELINNNSSISNEILNFYYLPTNNLISDDEFERFVKSGFIGKKNRITNPFSIKINNAYYKTSDILYKIKLCKALEYKINKRLILNLNDLMPYFLEYEKGFEIGFNDFEKDKITAFLPMFPDKNDFFIKTFEFLTNINFLDTTWLNSNRGFLLSEKEIIIDNAFEHGKKQGYFYKAWSIVFSNSKLFEPYFKQWFIENSKTKNEQNNENNKNPFPDIFINEDVYNCFKDYTEKHILDFHLDYSYLKKRLEKEKLIHNHKDNNFAKFLFENKFISESKYGKYNIENKFYSLKKSTSIQRENNFNIVFEKLLANQ